MIIRVLIENTACSGLHAEHGLSLYIEWNGRKILFDAGQSGLFAENAEQMGAALNEVDLAILSHGHYDHSGGLLRFLECNDHAPVCVSRHAFGGYYAADGRYIGVDPALKESGRLVLTGDETALCSGMTLYTMNGRPAAYPAAGHGLGMEKNGIIVPDEFLHEQYLLLEERGRRILISGCSHKGILNIMDWLKPDVLVGGFHFMKMDVRQEEEKLRSAADALLAFPAEYYTCHCTGLEQYAVLKERMGERLHYLSAGDVIEL